MKGNWDLTEYAKTRKGFLFYVGKEDIHSFEVKLITTIFFSYCIRLYKDYLWRQVENYFRSSTVILHLV